MAKRASNTICFAAAIKKVADLDREIMAITDAKYTRQVEKNYLVQSNRACSHLWRAPIKSRADLLAVLAYLAAGSNIVAAPRLVARAKAFVERRA